MTGEHPFVPRADFIENAFERRFQGLLRSARQDRSWHVVAAVPGSGQSFGIADLVTSAGAAKRPDGHTRLPILAVCAPKGKAGPSALGIALSLAFGAVPRMTGYTRRAWLVGQAARRAEVELIVIDDAHDLTLDHLAHVKELTDTLAAPPYVRQVGLCLVSASGQGLIPLQETFRTRQELIWRQFRRRLDPGQPYCLVLGHTADEVREICAGYEDVYRDQFPALPLVRWARSIYDWLTHPVLDPERSGRVTMSHLANLVRLGLDRAAVAGRDDVTGELLHEVASLMTLRAEEVALVDGEPGPRPAAAAVSLLPGSWNGGVDRPRHAGGRGRTAEARPQTAAAAPPTGGSPPFDPVGPGDRVTHPGGGSTGGAGLAAGSGATTVTATGTCARCPA